MTQQQMWNRYHNEIKKRLIAEAKILNTKLDNSGLTNQVKFVFDFTFFCTGGEKDAIDLQKELNENYQAQVVKKGDAWHKNSSSGSRYWYINATSRPNAVNLNAQQRISWVESMHEIAISHRCVFSAWTIRNNETNQVWSNENVDFNNQ